MPIVFETRYLLIHVCDVVSSSNGEWHVEPSMFMLMNRIPLIDIMLNHALLNRLAMHVLACRCSGEWLETI